jgi:tetratricopeptide (TPR) repeat protein
VYNNIGLVHADLAEWEPARDALENSLEISRKAGDTRGQATALSNLARVYFNQEEHRKAVEAAGEAADLFLEIRDWYRAATTVRGLGRYYRRTGMTANARAQLQRAAYLFHRAGAEREVEEANTEIERLDKKRGLPWYAWVSLVLFVLSVLVIIFAGAP